MSETPKQAADTAASPGSDDEISCENCVGACCQWSAGNFFIDGDDWHRHRQSMGLIPASPEISGPKPFDREISGYQKVIDSAGTWRTVEQKKKVPADQMVAEFKGAACRNLGAPAGDSMLRPCRIYEDRPKVCRELMVGSTACRNARRAAGLDGGQRITKEESYKEMGMSRAERRAAARRRH